MRGELGGGWVCVCIREGRSRGDKHWEGSVVGGGGCVGQGDEATHMRRTEIMGGKMRLELEFGMVEQDVDNIREGTTYN